MVSGPSGVGKSSVVAGLAERLPFHFSVSMTTRPPRPGEAEGSDYFFVGRDRFLAARDAGELLEWAEYSGHLYGTPRSQVEGPLAAGRDILLDIELLGAQQVKAAYPEALLVFVAPPSLEVLEARLRGRGQDDEAAIRRRLAVAGREIDAFEQYDYAIVNEDLDASVEELKSIVRAARCRVAVMRDQARAIERTFQSAKETRDA